MSLPDQREVQLVRLLPLQMKELELIIARSRDAKLFAKRVIVWLLRQTKQCTRPVGLSLLSGECGEQRVRDVQDGVHDMLSSHGSTHLTRILEGMKTPMRLGHCQGQFTPNGDEWFDHSAPARSIWFSFDDPSNIAFLPTPPLCEIEAITLSR
ncbi:MAG: hypothetical protein COU08_02155 [Candidatus Harrisonbacteria bacterium CG10_big_fil_rev_8_21_14_0_10_42_17]|uniref:Uncharacterized protein n=1 Tax=Candidatus Harrisonbacteria bacterium CG10_big_fil_rev_8_21_14_0_10_42_17 TaxID=1974584 RepID=A0A2M6WI77_9BACT|nr:MAG: hypothetical protein COU08_02155 [Candidatus Harrisonbacteria bacterium CG10_big_fil_rev_8_21_14_0_10_42_17]